jgi:hypothetical protein
VRTNHEHQTFYNATVMRLTWAAIAHAPKAGMANCNAAL